MNTYTGATTISNGTLALNGANRLSASTDVTVATGASLALANNNTAIASLLGAGSVSLGSGILTTGTNSSLFTGTLTGSGGLTKTGSGTLTLSGASTYSGATTLTGGQIVVRDAAALGLASGAISLAPGAELQLENNISLAAKALSLGGTLRNNSGTNTYAGNINLTANATLATDAGTLAVSGKIALSGNTLAVASLGTTQFSGILSGAGSLTKTGSGQLTLNGTNTFTGSLTISEGTLRAGSSSSLGATGAMNPATVVSGATLLLDESGGGVNVAAKTLNLAGIGVGGNGALRSNAGANTWSGSINLTANASIQVDADTFTLAGNVADSGGSRALTKTGSGTLLLDGALNQTGGINIVAGTVQLDSNDRLLSTGAVTISSGALLDLNDNDQTIGTFSGSGTVQTGPSIVANGGSTFTVGGSNLDATFSGSIQGLGDLEKTGTGVQTLASANSYTGATTVSGGKLEASTNNALGTTSSIQINSGGTLLLSGASATDRINNIATITMDGGTLARTTGSEGSGTSRSSAGILTGSSTVGLGVLTLTANSTIDFGTGATGTLNFASLVTNGFTLYILNYTGNVSGASIDGVNDRLIFDASQSGNLAKLDFGSGFAATQNSLGNGFYEVTVTPVPEPSTWIGALGISLMASMRFIRRKCV